MSYADCPAGRRLPAIVATVLLHGAAIALAAAAFDVVQGGKGTPGTELVAVFTAAPPPPSPPPEPARPPEPRATKRPKPESVPQETRVQPEAEAAPAAVPLRQGPPPAAPAVRPAALPRPVEAPAAAAAAEQAKASELAAYTSLLRERIAQRRPRGLRKQGTTLIAFRLDGAGALLSSEIADSSGDIQLDRLALRMVRQAAPFPAPPEGVSRQSLTFRLPVRFH